MNKALLILLLSVCLLGMALIMLNERLHGTSQKPAQVSAVEPAHTAENALSHTVPFDSASRQEVRGEASMVARRAEPEPRKESVQRREPQLRLDTRSTRADTESRKEPERIVDRKEAKVEEKQPEKRKAEVAAKDNAPKENVKVAEKKARATEKQPEAKAEQNLAVTNFVVFVRDNGATVRFDGNNDLRYKTLQMHNPERVLIEFEGKWDIDVPRIPKNEMVSQIRVARLTKKTRVVLDLKANPRSCRFVQKRKDNLDVRLDG
ncbi:MAG: AMIN domain-containing protein [Desulfovibrionaceae bacterium]|nr:AMIN domain-containing protein [Desulfovibrionaceae bacterium]